MENTTAKLFEKKCDHSYSDKIALLRKMQTVDFALQEANLFLDTHPNCKKALAYYEMYRKLRCELHEEYKHKYGPITRNDVMNADTWTWIDGPWPWEREV